MGTIMTNYCAAHYVWDGVHKRGKGDKLALKSSLPVLEKCLQEIMERVSTPNIQGKEVKKCAGRFLTLAPSRQGKNDPPLAFPWTYRQAEPMGEEANEEAH
ncbi:uncharacterized protein LOC124174183 [Ischnura elegans]|uniref:uncharacterized protein LOC124171609 n=1 Tax=Ischnura elegans TaxID=197161 RepID=UPI001ED88005|nr:uncharacterized protein LOC124171609 [Ischnura elegans]XP_046408131.1 uncharacterized protein LOC124172707 [Ischnura elegans]XP_046409239.1 uncharacterized protein LOC124174183 [Ischnura elegans]